MNLDVALFHRINDLAGSHPALDAVMIASAKYAAALYALVLAGCWIGWRQRWQRAAAVAAVGALVALGLGQVVGSAVSRPRPYLVMPAHVLVAHAPDSSFPSDHALLVGAITVGLWRLSRRLDVGLVFLGLIVLVGRVYIGVHYPSDALGGALIGGLVAGGLRVLGTHAGKGTLDAVFSRLHRYRLASGR